MVSSWRKRQPVWCFLSLRFPSFICGSLYQCVLFLYILFLVLPIFEVPVPNSVVPNFSRSYVWCFLLLRSYLCVFLSLCYPKNGEAPLFLFVFMNYQVCPLHEILKRLSDFAFSYRICCMMTKHNSCWKLKSQVGLNFARSFISVK